MAPFPALRVAASRMFLIDRAGFVTPVFAFTESFLNADRIGPKRTASALPGILVRVTNYNPPAT